MRKIHILFCLSFFLIFGCLEDEGNYDYDDIKEPKWHTDQPISVYATEHNVMKLRGHDAFRWDTDSVSREREVRYEWKLNDVVIATEADIDIPVDSVIKWTKMEELCATDKWVRGSFTVIDKEFETHFMKVVSFFITPYRSNGDWFVLTEKEGEGECYFVKRTYNREESKDEFELQDSFSEINALSISGKPVFLGYTRTAKNVGPMGSITIMTDEVAYEVDAATFELHSELKDLFGGGVPSGFSPVARVDAWEADRGTGLCTFLANKDGKLYRRQLSKNNLGGMFINTPYELDEKGYKITEFGTRLYGFTSIPCWDEKNNRVIMIAFASKQAGSGWGDPSYLATSLIPLKNDGSLTNCPPVWGFESGTKVLNMGYMKSAMLNFTTSLNVYSVIYNDASGKTWCGEFIMNPSDGSIKQSVAPMPPFYPEGADSRVIECPARISDDALILVTCSSSNAKAKNQVVYTDGNHVNYLLVASKYASKPMITDFPEKVTYIGYGTSDVGAIGKYDLLVVGGENGTLKFYDISDRDRPKCVETMTFDGKITMAKEMATGVTGVDEY